MPLLDVFGEGVINNMLPADGNPPDSDRNLVVIMKSGSGYVNTL